MKHLITILKSFLSDQEGQSNAEYILLIAFIGVSAVVILTEKTNVLTALINKIKMIIQ